MSNPPSPCGEGSGEGRTVSAGVEPPPQPLPTGEGLARPITVAAITGAHGIEGQVRLKLFGAGVAALRQYGAFNEGALVLKKAKDDGKGGAIARFAGIDDRNAAEALRGTALTVSREALPPLAEGEYYFADLIGLAAVSDEGEPLGTVVNVENYGAGDVVEIERETGKRFMVPMSEQAVPEWNAERLVVAAAFAQD